MLKHLPKALIFVSFCLSAQAENTDSTQKVTTFSGSVGVTNNGFSIIPTFSLNSPAAIVNLAWRRKNFSLEPDIRLVPNLSKGGILLWARYHGIQKGNFGMRLGAHPALSIIRRGITENGTATEISELLRFAAFEVVPSYKINNHVSLGAMYLQGHGLQKNGPQTTKVLFLNVPIMGLKVTENVNFSLIPMVYFINTDDYPGQYFTATGIIAHKKWPVSLQSAINQTIKSEIPGNKDFMWNVSVVYGFSKKLLIK